MNKKMVVVTLLIVLLLATVIIINKGKITFRQKDMSMAAPVSEEALLYPKAEHLSSEKAGADAIVLISDAPFETVVDFYKNQLKGVEWINESNKTTRSVTCLQKDLSTGTSKALITISQDENSPHVRINLGKSAGF